MVNKKIIATRSAIIILIGIMLISSKMISNNSKGESSNQPSTREDLTSDTNLLDKKYKTKTKKDEDGIEKMITYSMLAEAEVLDYRQDILPYLEEK